MRLCYGTRLLDSGELSQLSPERWGWKKFLQRHKQSAFTSHTATTGNVRDSKVPANTVDEGRIFTSSSEPIMGSCGKRDDVLCLVENSTSFEPMECALSASPLLKEPVDHIVSLVCMITCKKAHWQLIRP